MLNSDDMQRKRFSAPDRPGLITARQNLEKTGEAPVIRLHSTAFYSALAALSYGTKPFKGTSRFSASRTFN